MTDFNDIDCASILNFFAWNKSGNGEQSEEVLRESYKPHEVKTFEAGTMIAEQGESVNSLVMLTKGSVRMEIISRSGEKLYVSEHAAPFPLIASLLYSSHKKYVNDIIATEECKVEYYDFETIDRLLGESPSFRRGFLAYSSNLIYGLSEQLQIFSIRKIKGKLAYYILQKAEPSGFFELGMSVTALAQYFGVTRSALSRVIAELTNEGSIYYTKGFGEILNYNNLQKEL